MLSDGASLCVHVCVCTVFECVGEVEAFDFVRTHLICLTYMRSFPFLSIFFFLLETYKTVSETFLHTSVGTVKPKLHII